MNVNQVERYIREAAVKRGIDPNTAVRVARTEGLKPGTWQSDVGKKAGRRERSFGPFQLNIDGGLGTEFQRETGLDPTDPSTVEAQVDFALDHAAKNGWGAFHGAKNNGISNRAGLANARPIGRSQAATNVASAAPAAAPGGLLASFFGPSSAAADEMPGGIMAPSKEADYFGSEPTTDWSAQREEVMKERAANAPQQAPQAQFTGSAVASDFAPTQASIAGLMGRPVNQPQAMTDPTQATAGFQGGQVGAPKVDQAGGIMSTLGDTIGGLLGPQSSVAEGFQRSPDGQVADPFGNYKPGGPLATVQKMDERAPGAEVAYSPPDEPGSIHVGGLQSIGPETKTTGTPPSSLMSPNPIGQLQQSLAAPGVGAMPDMEKYGSFTPQVGGLMQGFAPQMGPPKTIEDTPTIAAPEEAPTDPYAPDPALSTYPDAPREPTRLDQAIATARMGINQLRQGLENGINSGPPARGGTDYGSGMAAMQAAMSGAPGGMAQSRSNPGYGYQKTDTGGIRTGPYGWQALDASGETSGGLHRYDGDTSGSFLGGLFGGTSIGGLFGGEGRGKSKGKDKDRDGKERGGLY